MISIMVRNQGKRWFKYLLLGIFALLILDVVGIGAAGVKSNVLGGGSCYGSYLVNLETGFDSIWTFSKDGTFQGTSSAEPGTLDDQQEVYGFSHQQGSWVHTTGRQISATWINFSFFNSSIPPTWIGYGRDDAVLTFDNSCHNLWGTTDVRFYDLTKDEDPLDPSQGLPIPFLQDVEFTGRRINPG